MSRIRKSEQVYFDFVKLMGWVGESMSIKRNKSTMLMKGKQIKVVKGKKNCVGAVAKLLHTKKAVTGDVKVVDPVVNDTEVKVFDVKEKHKFILLVLKHYCTDKCTVPSCNGCVIKELKRWIAVIGLRGLEDILSDKAVPCVKLDELNIEMNDLKKLSDELGIELIYEFPNDSYDK